MNYSSLPQKIFLALALCIPAGQTAFAAPQPPAFGTDPIIPVSHPYGAAEGAQQAVDAAFQQARQTGRKVLLDFGANWCPDCQILAGVLKRPAIAAWVDQNFVVVALNVDRASGPTDPGERFNNNIDIARKYGVTIKAIPAVLVFTPEGRLLNGDNALVLGNARTLSGQAIVDQLNEWAQHS